MSQISITALDEGSYGVEVVEGQRSTMHRVTVPRSLLDALGLEDADAEALVRESFEFLLEREPPTSILLEFSLDTIPQYFPEYEQELKRRLDR